MSRLRRKLKSDRFRIFNFKEFSKKVYFCSHQIPEMAKLVLSEESQSYSKTKKIDDLIMNIYVYKFPPILNWTEGIYLDIPVDYVTAIKKMMQHSSEDVLNNIQELCFSQNADSGSYGDKVIIIPIEYLTENYNKNLFLDAFAHELGHALANELAQDTVFKKQIQSWHKIIQYYSLKFNDNLFYDPGISELSLSEYQLKDYKEFISELYSQILNYFNKLLHHICQIKFQEAQYAYLNMVDLLLHYLIPFSETERTTLVSSL